MKWIKVIIRNHDKNTTPGVLKLIDGFLINSSIMFAWVI